VSSVAGLIDELLNKEVVWQVSNSNGDFEDDVILVSN
jgi:hypothetical protein